MRSLLSRLSFGWAALAAGLCLALPSPQATWVAALAVAAAGLSLVLGRRGGAADDADGHSPGAGDASLLDTAAMLVRGASHARDLPEALHGAARVLFQELGAEGLVTGRLDAAGAALPLERYTDPAARGHAALHDTMSEVADEAVHAHRVAGNLQRGFAVPVLREGRSVAWLEFRSIETSIAEPSLRRLLELLKTELSAVAERGVWHVGARAATPGETRPWRERDAANAPIVHLPDTRRPAPNASRAWLVRYPKRGGAQGHAAVLGNEDVLDHTALDRLRALDPSGVGHLFERLGKAFEASATRLIPQLRESVRAGDADGIRQVARALRPASASIGALTLTRLCADLESRTGENTDGDLAGQVKLVVGEIDLVMSVLRGLPVLRT
jgi:HPt (histidine-containing phosphotransfer) domain-containing protein